MRSANRRSDSVSVEVLPRPTAVTLALAGWFVLVFLTATGCATVAHGLNQDLSIRSDPPGARISINGKASGETPAIVTVRRRRGVLLRLEKKNFEPLEMRIPRKPSAWLWVDAAICFNPFAAQGLDRASQWPALVGTCLAELVGLDLLLGGAYKFRKVPTINLTMRPSEPAAASLSLRFSEECRGDTTEAAGETAARGWRPQRAAMHSSVNRSATTSCHRHASSP